MRQSNTQIHSGEEFESHLGTPSSEMIAVLSHCQITVVLRARGKNEGSKGQKEVVHIVARSPNVITRTKSFGISMTPGKREDLIVPVGQENL